MNLILIFIYVYIYINLYIYIYIYIIIIILYYYNIQYIQTMDYNIYYTFELLSSNHRFGFLPYLVNYKSMHLINNAFTNKHIINA